MVSGCGRGLMITFSPGWRRCLALRRWPMRPARPGWPLPGTESGGDPLCGRRAVEVAAAIGGRRVTGSRPTRKTRCIWLACCGWTRSPRQSRHRLRDWLAGQNLPSQFCADVLLAADEASSTPSSTPTGMTSGTRSPCPRAGPTPNSSPPLLTGQMAHTSADPGTRGRGLVIIRATSPLPPQPRLPENAATRAER
jgi:hypothetical protein